MKKILRYVFGLFIAYAAYASFFYVTQRSILFPVEYARIPPGIADQIPDSLKIWIQTEYGKTESWYLPPFDAPKEIPHPLFIIGHGNGDVIDRWVGAMNVLREYGIGVLLVEYPGYGRSEGEPSEESIQRVFVESYDTIITNSEIDKDRIVLLGQSIGGGSVCKLAKKRNASAIILISSFTNVSVFASNFLLPNFLVKDPFDNLSVISEFDGPTLFIHGINDDLIPFEESEKLLHSSQNGSLISLDGNHNLYIKSSSFWIKYIVPFLQENNILQQ